MTESTEAERILGDEYRAACRRLLEARSALQRFVGLDPAPTAIDALGLAYDIVHQHNPRGAEQLIAAACGLGLAAGLARGANVDWFNAALRHSGWQLVPLQQQQPPPPAPEPDFDSVLANIGWRLVPVGEPGIPPGSSDT